MSNPVNILYATEHWAKQVEAWKRSNLSQTEFCKRNELVYHQFIYWRTKIERDGPARRSKQQIGSGFTRVNVKPTLVDGLTLSLPNGFVLQGINRDNVTVVRELLGQL